MNYKLSKLQLGTNKVDCILEFSSLFKITEFCYIDGFGYILLFKDQHCLGLIDSKNKFIFPWAGELNIHGHYDSTAPLFEYPSSICYSDKVKKAFIIENGGMRIREIDINPFYTSSVFGIAVEKKMEKYFENFESIKDVNTSCCTDNNGNIYWTVRELNRCFKYNFSHSDFEEYMGNGKYGFSIASNFRSSLISLPSGLLHLGDSIYIADTGNHCIREEAKIIIGSPSRYGYKDDLGIDSILNSPTKIISLKKILCFIDIDKIRYYSLADKLVGTLYKSPYIVSIESNKKDLIILEIHENY